MIFALFNENMRRYFINLSETVETGLSNGLNLNHKKNVFRRFWQVICYHYILFRYFLLIPSVVLTDKHAAI